MRIYSGNHRKLELFVQAEDADSGFLSVRDVETGKVLFQSAIPAGPFRFLEIALETEKTYKLLFQDVLISQMYLSGNDDIMETGVTYLMVNGESMEQLRYEDILDTPIREQYHFTPFVNWCNDPNGLCWYKGYYHLFYQSNPNEQKWGNMYWGHAVSKDLMQWKYMPYALKPQRELFQSNKLVGGAFSGCAVPQKDELQIFFTRDIEKIGDPESIRQSQWTAVSKDGITFSDEEELIPALSLKGADVNFRDPKVFFRDEKWYMLLASNYGGKGTILLYSSLDQKKWNFIRPLLQLDDKNVPSLECPDFFRVDGCDVLMAAVMGIRTKYGVYQPVQYYIGQWKNEQFTIRKTGVCDFGSNFYAVQSFEHLGRRILIGWICDWAGEHETIRHGAYGSFTLPRIVAVRDGVLYQKPADEVYRFAGDTLLEACHCDKAKVLIQQNNYYACIQFEGETSFEILAARDGDSYLKLRGDGRKLEILSDRNKDTQARYIAETQRIEKVELFMDRRVLEVYINNGEQVGTRLFIKHSKDGVFSAAFEEGQKVGHIVVKQMMPIWRENRG
ncbi:glycoside hydrolase family protein [Porcincola intestinalis]|uniref:beta-fructofuranosidase n=1 Tax=Porcincola intestinalis TaxID=2606632 RepID=A0A6L5X4Q7_9FIRM|nr:glycoside hydrolase family 32 protein [Porcincola intestinalis]MSS13946.1 glycoside hydrolase family 32 protein [Porcincola intestinalis]